MSPLKIRVQGNPLAIVVILLAVSWFVLEMVVGFDFIRDDHVACEGTVLEIKTTWIDRLALDWLSPEHLIKERGFGNDPHVPGKPTVTEMLEEHRGR